MYWRLLIIIMIGIIMGGCDGIMTTNPASVDEDHTHNTNIVSSEVWTADAPHFIESEIYIQNAIIKIEPGAVIKFKNGAALNIMESSGIIADGMDKPINFQLADGEEGFWKHLYFADNVNDDSCKLINCRFLSGGGDNNWQSTIYCQNASPIIMKCEIKNSASNGLYLSGACTTGIFVNNVISQNNGAPIVTNACNVSLIGIGSYTGNTEDCIKIVAGKVSQNVAWPLLDVPYHIDHDLSIENANLTLLPGSVIKFYPQRGLRIVNGGSLTADGFPKNILFSALESTRGFWDGIIFDHSSFGLLNNCVVEYGGHDVQHPANICIENSSPSIKNCIIRKSGQYGIYIKGKFSPDTFVNNEIIGNDKAPVSTNAENVTKLPGNYYLGNSYDFIEVRGGNLEGQINNASLWQDHGIPYCINNNLIIRQAILQIDPGVVLKMNSRSHIDIMEGGGLIADGTTNPIYITGKQKTPGYWDCVYFSDSCNDANCILKNCYIEYGGGDQHKPGNIFCDNSSPTISYCSIENSLHYGIYLAGKTNAVIENNSFYNNFLGEIYP